MLYSVDWFVRSSLSPLRGDVVPVSGWVGGPVGFVSSFTTFRVVFVRDFVVFLSPSIFLCLAGLVLARLTVCGDI